MPPWNLWDYGVDIRQEIFRRAQWTIIVKLRTNIDQRPVGYIHESEDTWASTASFLGEGWGQMTRGQDEITQRMQFCTSFKKARNRYLDTTVGGTHCHWYCRDPTSCLLPPQQHHRRRCSRHNRLQLHLPRPTSPFYCHLFFSPPEDSTAAAFLFSGGSSKVISFAVCI